MRGRPRKYPGSAKISGNIPQWKKDLLDCLGIQPTTAIDQGIDLLLGNAIQNGRISRDAVEVYILGIKTQIAELNEKVRQAEKLQHHREKEKQITVWDMNVEEIKTIPICQFNPKVHAIREAR